MYKSLFAVKPPIKLFGWHLQEFHNHGPQFRDLGKLGSIFHRLIFPCLVDSLSDEDVSKVWDAELAP